jgi:hypothetical protein
MKFIVRYIFLGVFILSVTAQGTSSGTITHAPTASATAGNGPLPLTQYTFTYPNVVCSFPIYISIGIRVDFFSSLNRSIRSKVVVDPSRVTIFAIRLRYDLIF